MEENDPHDTTASGADFAEETKPGVREAFAREFAAAPEESVAALTRAARTGKHTGREVAEILLPYLVKASYAQQNLIVSALDEATSPQDLLQAALSAYEETDDPRLLTTADALLASRREGSWPALAQLARSRRPEAHYFVRTLATLDGVREEQREAALLELVRNPNLDTRREVLEVLEGGILSDPLPLWKALADDEDADVRGLARDRLASLTS